MKPDEVLKINEVLQPPHKEEHRSTHYRVVIDTKRTAASALFTPQHWERHTLLRKGDIIRCVADDWSYVFDLIVDSQKLDFSKSARNVVAVSKIPKLTDDVIAAAAARAAEFEAELEAAAVAQEAGATTLTLKKSEPAIAATPTDKPAIDTNVSFAKRKEIAKRQKLLDKRAEIEAANKARTAERLAAGGAA